MDPSVVRALRHCARVLAGVPYVLIGSCNLALQGIPVSPRDIDILATPAGAERADAILAPYRVTAPYFDTSDGRNSLRAFYAYASVEIEVLGNVSNAHRTPDAHQRAVSLRIGELAMPGLPLEEELDAYRRMGRAEKAALIEKFLSDTARA